MIDWTSLPNDVVAAGVIAALGLVLRHLNSRYAPKIDMFKSVAAIFRADILAEQEGRPLPPIPVGDTEAKDGKPC